MNEKISVPSHYAKIPIISAAKKNGGLFIDGDWIESKDLSDEGIRYLTTGNVGLGEFKDQGSGYISEDTFHRLGCTEVLPGDILVSRLNLPYGRACLVPDIGERMVTAVDNVILRPCEEFNRKFLVFLFTAKHHTEMMKNLARGTTMLRISRSALGRARIFVPPLPEQTAIANYLDRETARWSAPTEVVHPLG
jgi:type I restriction enzyme S subunit